MNRKRLKSFLLITLLLVLCFTATSCGIRNLLGQKIVNEIENKYIEYSQDITVDDIEDALTTGAEIAKSSSIGVKISNRSLLGTINETGSGVIIKRTKQYNNTYYYLAVTNRHVTGTKINGELSVYLGNSIYVEANLVTYDTDTDLALISFTTGVLLNVVTFNQSELKCGQFAIAVGSPYDLENYFNTVTVGSISATDRIHIENNLNGEEIENTYIQHDAAINSGNSGGGLFDIYGNLIGINTWKLVGDNSDHIEGMSFAIPVSTVLDVFASYVVIK